MALLDGEIARIVGAELVKAGLAKPATLTKVTPTQRDPSSVTAPTTPLTQDFACQGFVANFAHYQVAGTLLAGVKRVVKIYGSTIAGGAVPAPRDRITIEGVTSFIADQAGAVVRDPAGAVYTCQCL